MITKYTYQGQNEEKYKIERIIANEILDTIHRLQLPLKLDQLTEGQGNCFPIAIIQQLRRPEIFSQLRPKPKRLVRQENGHSMLRNDVMQFIMKSRIPRIAQFRAQYEETDGTVNGKTWHQYWETMTTDRTWVDYWFVQSVAWYLLLDIWIVATSSTETHPYIGISGNLADENLPCSGPIITLGTKSNSHYQSLLPIEMFHLDFRQNEQHSNTSTETRKLFNQLNCSEDKMEVQGKRIGMQGKELKDTLNGQPNESEVKKNINEIPNEIGCRLPFTYESNNNKMTFLCISDDYIMQCPMCLKETRYITQHISKNKNCQIPVN